MDFAVDSAVFKTAFDSGKPRRRTDVEMEALTAVQVGLLSVYDMCKAADRGMTITGVRLLEKRGGKSGNWIASEPAPLQEVTR